MDTLAQYILSGIEDKYVIIIFFIWVMTNGIIRFWKTPPSRTTKMYIVYNIIFMLANFIPAHVMLARLLTVEENKEKIKKNQESDDAQKNT